MKNWDQQNDLVIRGFCYIRPLYNEVPLYNKIPDITIFFGPNELICFVLYSVLFFD